MIRMLIIAMLGAGSALLAVPLMVFAQNTAHGHKRRNAE